MSTRKTRNHSQRKVRSTLIAPLAALVLSSLALGAPYFATAKDKDKDKDQKAAQKAANKDSTKDVLGGLPATDLTEDQAIAHALNRLGYGPRPGDVERVKQMGLGKWIDEQLHPDAIDDSALDARLSQFPTLGMSSTKLINTYPRPAQVAKRQGITPDEYKKQQQEQAQNQQAMNLAQAVANTQNDDMTPAQAAQAAGVNPNPLAAFAQIKGPQRVVGELALAKTERAVYSERQLYEEMVDFWFNHFNVYANKGLDPYLLTAYERDAIRPNAMGKFRDLLEATAKSPAMLFYLDNWQSVDPDAFKRVQEAQQERQAMRGVFTGPRRMPPPPPQNQQQAQKKNPDRGINENYGRELMELHTLGVDGGYTQQDVVEVARAFTGWTIRTPQRAPEFYFDDRFHDTKPKTVLGHTIDAGGMKDGEEVLDILARDPHTAHHLSLEIAQHFVSDNPPEALVKRMADTYEQTDGDIRAVLHTMIYSPEFWSRDAYRAKIKTPFELVASAARAVDAQVDVPVAMVQWTGRIGEPLYQCQPPTGYDDKASTWVNTGALLNRLNYSLTLASGRMVGTHVDAATLLGTGDSAQPDAALDRAIAVLLSGEVSPETRATLAKQMNDPQVLQAQLDDPVRQVNQGLIAGLVLGAPEFQRR